MYIIYSAYITYIYILYKYTQIGNSCILLYNIYAIMKTICFPSHRSNGFVATHALGHINLSQGAFWKVKLRCHLLHHFFCGEERNSEIFILQFSVYFQDACKPLAKNTYAREAEFLKVTGHARFKCFINKLEGMTQCC